jgi:hypothetical protein
MFCRWTLRDGSLHLYPDRLVGEPTEFERADIANIDELGYVAVGRESGRDD